MEKCIIIDENPLSTNQSDDCSIVSLMAPEKKKNAMDHYISQLNVSFLFPAISN